MTDNGLRFWTSGNDISLEGQWVWASTGYGFTFFDWHGGQPDNYGNNEDVMEFRGLAWNDVPDGMPLLPLCERVGIL